jgi:thiamine-monophosphate kinase
MNEFEIIRRYFISKAGKRPDVLLGAGDDCALLQVPLQNTLAVSIDTLVAGVHFFENAHPADIGYKALAVNLSDLAAMGAEPAWITAALTLPRTDLAWLESFCAGFFPLASQFAMQLVGGDLTRGPLSITLQVHGFIPPKLALKRSGAQIGDRIYVTGTLGDAALALQVLTKQFNLTKASDENFILQRLHHPIPRVAIGIALRGIATSAIDISDGLAADLRHVLEASGVGARLYLADLPFSSILQTQVLLEEAALLALQGGDDYELCFTIPPENEAKLQAIFKALDCRYTCIGIIEQEPGLRLYDSNNHLCNFELTGFQHF